MFASMMSAYRIRRRVPAEFIAAGGQAPKHVRHGECHDGIIHHTSDKKFSFITALVLRSAAGAHTAGAGPDGRLQQNARAGEV
jgi:hypothetical protein